MTWEKNVEEHIDEVTAERRQREADAAEATKKRRAASEEPRSFVRGAFDTLKPAMLTAEKLLKKKGYSASIKDEGARVRLACGAHALTVEYNESAPEIFFQTDKGPRRRLSFSDQLKLVVCDDDSTTGVDLNNLITNLLNLLVDLTEQDR